MTDETKEALFLAYLLRAVEAAERDGRPSRSAAESAVYMARIRHDLDQQLRSDLKARDIPK